METPLPKPVNDQGLRSPLLKKEKKMALENGSQEDHETPSKNFGILVSKNDDPFRETQKSFRMIGKLGKNSSATKKRAMFKHGDSSRILKGKKKLRQRKKKGLFGRKLMKHAKSSRNLHGQGPKGTKKKKGFAGLFGKKGGKGLKGALWGKMKKKLTRGFILK